VAVRAPVLLCCVLSLSACSGVGNQPVGVSGDEPTQDGATRSAPVVPGRPARVFIFAGLGDTCEPMPAPQLSVLQEPQKGELKFVPDQQTAIQSSARGTCIGRMATGTAVYYTARERTEGTDRFAISATLKSGESIKRTFEVTIAP
jgi:hypothetical protein